MSFVRATSEPELPPPALVSGPLAWARANLLSSRANAATTLALVALLAWLIPPLVSGATVDAIWSAPDGALFLTASDSPDAPSVRARIAHDGATPSGVGLMAEVYARLHHLTDAAEWREAAERLIRAFTGVAPVALAQSPLLLAAADMRERGGCVVVEGPLDDPRAMALAAAALAAPDPALTVLRLDRAVWP